MVITRHKAKDKGKLREQILYPHAKHETLKQRIMDHTDSNLFHRLQDINPVLHENDSRYFVWKCTTCGKIFEAKQKYVRIKWRLTCTCFKVCRSSRYSTRMCMLIVGTAPRTQVVPGGMVVPRLKAKNKKKLRNILYAYAEAATSVSRPHLKPYHPRVCAHRGKQLSSLTGDAMKRALNST